MGGFGRYRGGLFVATDFMDYLKLYNLEEYLFKEVNSRFHKNHYLTVEDFFCIVIWKANRAKTKIRNRLLKVDTNLEGAVKALTLEIYQQKNIEDRLQAMLNQKWGFSLPMATAILTVLYHKGISVYDVRVRAELKLKEIYTAEKYFSYFLPAVQKFAKSHNLSLRDADKYLWGKSFHEDLKRLVNSRKEPIIK